MDDPVSKPGAGFHFRIALPCELESVRPAALKARGLLADLGATPEDQTGCELALVEACNNAVLYSREKQRPIVIQILAEGPALELQVIDHTSGFDWPEHLELPSPEAEHGRGLFIIRSVMDEVLYLKGGGENRLVMRKANIFFDSAGNASMSEQLEKTREKLALTEQVISGMAKELWTQLASARAEKEKVETRLLAHELEIARQIQNSLLPKTFPPLPGFKLSGFCLSARQVGGDFYDVLQIAPEIVLLVVADVMGKGVPAALFAATLRTLLRTTIQWIRRPAKLLRRINRLMYDDLSGVDMFITAQLVLVDNRVGRLVVANAGHCPLLLSNEPGQIETISPEGMPLGILPEMEFEEDVVPFSSRTCVLLYSDGLTEARNPNGELFGSKRLADWLLQQRARNCGAVELSSGIQQELKRFQETVSPTDDQTGLILASESPSAVNPGLVVPMLASTALGQASQ
jgi:serine phosphatase RsbU (regulator of sigma subunit)/anti-sigma regulatory factor (Ser/Thr protein kinase)